MTMIEHSTKPAAEISFAYCGDARNNVASSLLVAGAMTGMDVRMVAPRELWCADHVVAGARRVAEATGARLTLTDSVEEGVAGVGILYTDGRVSLGGPPEAGAVRSRLVGSDPVNKDRLEERRVGKRGV